MQIEAIVRVEFDHGIPAEYVDVIIDSEKIREIAEGMAKDQYSDTLSAECSDLELIAFKF